MERMDLTVCELFAGVGGFHLGLAKNGWKVIWADQWEPGKKDQWAFQCYRRHFEPEGTQCVNEDIGAVETDAIPPVTLLVGGFPCQDYSVATTKAHGIEGKKGVLWWHIERILRENIERGTPVPYVLLENVDRLVRSPAVQRGRDFGMILSCLNNLGYVAEWRVINASDQGYPQKRRRTFIFATLVKGTGEKLYGGTNDVNIVTKQGFFASEFPSRPNGDDVGAQICLSSDLITMTKRFKFDFQNAGYMKDGRVFTIRVVPTFTWDKSSGRGTLSNVLEKQVDDKYLIPKEWIGDEKDRGTEGFKRTWRYCKGAKDEPRVHKNGHAYYYNEGGIPFPDKLDEPSRTLLTSEGNIRPNRISHIIPVDPEQNLYRVLTPVETERLNGFDDNWTDGMPEKWRYFCMGNALVVGLIEQMGLRLRDLIDEAEQDSSIDEAEQDSSEEALIKRAGGAIVGPLDIYEKKISDAGRDQLR